MTKRALSILVIGFGGKGVGDQIVATPFIRILKSNFPDAEIDYGASSSLGVELLKSDPHLRDCFVLGMDCFKIGGSKTFSDKISCVKFLRSKHYDQVFTLNTKLRAAIAAFVSGAKKRFGFAPNYSWLLLSKYWLEPLEKNLVDRFLDMLVFEGLSVASNTIKLYLEPSETASAIERLRGLFPAGRPVVAIAPFAADMRRTWGVERFLQLADRCSSQGWGVVLLGSAEDRQLMSEHVLDENIVDQIGKMTIRETAAVIKEVSAFAGNDSGLAHVAGAVDTPGVVIGYHVTKVWYPSAPSIQTVIMDPGCTSCDVSSCFTSNDCKLPCFEAVSVDDIFSRLQKLVRG